MLPGHYSPGRGLGQSELYVPLFGPTRSHPPPWSSLTVVLARPCVSAQAGIPGYGYAGSQKVIDYDAIMAGRLGAAEKAGLAELAELVEAGEEARRGSHEGMSGMLPLMRRYDTRCFALEVLGDGEEEEEEMEERAREQRQKRKQQQQQVGRSGVDDEEEALTASKKIKLDVPPGGEGNLATVDTERVGTLVEDLLGKATSGETGNDKEKEKRAGSVKKRVKKEDGGWEAPKAPTLAGMTVRVRGKDLTLPHGWSLEEVAQPDAGAKQQLQEQDPVFLSPEGIVCFGEEMMMGCEQTRKRAALNFERSMHLVKMDVMKLARQPRLGEVSDKALGRDGLVIYRRGMALQWKKLGLLLSRAN